ncbi:hypothetical protein BDV38DRAFT_297017 [Aspergillus pseudotamarii]|uniref:Uncharacterized protein n=1 Tax=Aspergillus pseudotamarii TaxID=132259 RepID=A0A5N6SFE3_ASPPS|nr:uncharacterized protein BDV38DRAFT_297017 [Aspergillus pseudotamarii]KAE8132430.1 hypothetical protein BDV38DRAFT_297017 [Aspergillus pseudotamarii]
MSPRQPYTAEDIIDDVLQGLASLKAFFAYDKTGLVLHMARAAKENPRLGLEVGQKGKHPTLGDLFIRLLTCICWAQRLQQFNTVPFRSTNKTGRIGLAASLSRRYGLEPNHVIRNSFRCGRQLQKIETRVGVENCSIVLLPSLPKLLWLSDKEILRLIDLLSSSFMSTLNDNRRLIEEFREYRRLYNTVSI